jgi:hypothetical protein
MRLHGLLIGLLTAPAACSSSASSSNPTDGGVLSDGAGALTCGSTVAAYCTATPCQMTLAGATQDKSLCPASLTPCGDYDVIIKSAIDTSTTYYYFQGSLLAVGRSLLPGKTTCLAGPSTFTPPSCTGTSQTLPACQ